MTQHLDSTGGDDRAGVIELNETLLNAWNLHDAEAFAAPWAEGADHVNVFGDIMLGKAQILTGTRSIFAGLMSHSESAATVRSLRFLSADVAILDVDQTLTGITTSPGAVVPFIIDGRMESRIKIVAVRSGGAWTVASFQNTAVLPRRQPPFVNTAASPPPGGVR